MSQEFKTVREVAAYLQKEGRKIAESTVYKHVQEGRLRTNKDGNFTLKAVKNYSWTLKRVDTMQKDADHEHYQRKISYELEKAELQLEYEKFKFEREKGNYISRNEEDLRLASLVAIFKTKIKNDIQSRAVEVVEAIDPIEKYIQVTGEVVDDACNLLAKYKEWNIIFLTNDESIDNDEQLISDDENPIN